MRVPQLETRNLLPQDVDYCESLWVDRMADGYENTSLLRDIAADLTGTHGTVGTIDNEDTVIGFAAGYLGTMRSVVSIPYTDVYGKSIYIDPKRKVWYWSILVIEGNQEGNGCATQIANEFITALDAGIPIIAETWDRDGERTAAHVNERVGMKQVASRDGYWEHTQRLEMKRAQVAMRPRVNVAGHCG